MALTRVAPAGIGSTPGTGYVIGDSFLHATGLNATNAYYTGIVTAQTFRVIGDFQVDGTTTTLDTEVTSVDKLEVGANNNTVGVAITQSGTGDILNLYDGSTEVFSVTDGGKVKIGTTTEGISGAHNLTIGESGHGGITIRTGTTSAGAIYFADSTSGDAQFDGFIQYNQQTRYLRFGTAQTEKVRITSAGLVGIGTDNPTNLLHVYGQSRFEDYLRGNTTHNKLYILDDVAISATKKLYFDGGSNTYIDEVSADTLTITTGGTERLRIKSDGDVIIGTNDLESQLGSRRRLAVCDTTNGALLHLRGQSPAIFFDQSGGNIGKIYLDSADFAIYADTPNSEGTERLRINSAGDVGIGENSPDVRLHVTETFNTAYSLTSVTTDTNHLLKLENPSTTANAFAGMQFRVGSGADLYFGAIQQSVNHGDFFFANQNSPQIEMMRIKSTGLVGIGTDNPSAKLDIRGQSNTNFEALRLRNTHGAGGSQGQVDLNFDVITSTNQVARSRIRGQESTSDAPYSELTFWTSETTSTEPTKRVTISKTGGVLIGEHTTAVDGGNAPNLEIVNTSTSTLTLARNDTSISSGNDIAAIRVWGNDSNGTYQRCAEILAEADGDHANDDKPTALSFKVSADGSVTPVERLRITSAGKIGVGVAAPAQMMEITNTASTGAQIQFRDTSTGNAGSNGFRIGYNGSGGQLWNFESTYIRFATSNAERLRITSDGQIDVKYGVINLGTADSSSGHINAYELMTFNIDSDNDDTTRHFTWYKNGLSGSGTGMMRLTEDGRLVIGGDLGTSANNLTLKHASTVEIDMTCTGGSGNLFRIKSDSAGKFTIRDHSSGNDRLAIIDNGNTAIGHANPDSRLHVYSTSNHAATFEYSSTSDCSIQLKNTQGSIFFGLGGNEGFGVSTDSDINGSNNRFMILQDGKTGINNASPPVRLAIADSNDVKLLLSSSWSGTQQILFGGGSNNSTGAANSTAAIIKCTSSAPSGAAVGQLQFLVNNGDNFDDDRLTIYPQGLGNAKTNGGPALSIRSGQSVGNPVASTAMRIRPQFYDADLGAGFAYFQMAPSSSDSTPTLVWRFGTNVKMAGEITLTLVQRTNSPVNARFDRLTAKYRFAFYAEGDNDGSGLRHLTQIYKDVNSCDIDSVSIVYVDNGHSQYGTNNDTWKDGYGYFKFYFSGLQGHTICCKIDLTQGLGYVHETYFE